MSLTQNQFKKYRKGILTILMTISFVWMSGCQQAPVAPKIIKTEAQPIGFRDGNFFVKKESTSSERVYYVFDLTTVTRQVFNDDGLIETHDEGTFLVTGDSVDITSTDGSTRQLTVTPKGDLKSSLGSLWTYVGPVEKADETDSTGGKVFKDVYEVQTVKPLKATLIRTWKDGDSALYYMTFKNSETEITLQMESPPAKGFFNADGTGMESKWGKRYKVYYLEKETGDRVLVSIEQE